MTVSSASPLAFIRDFPSRRIAVIGDVMLDHFVIGTVDRISPEAPVPVVRYQREEYRLGGAANVANNVATLGARTSLIGLVGDDEAGAQVRHQLTSGPFSGAHLVVDAARPTTRKTRIVTSRNQQVARIDRESEGPVTGEALAALIGQIQSAAQGAHALVLSDYRKGVVVPDVIAAAAHAAAEYRIPLLVDPKVAVAERYVGATVMTPNHHEAELMTQRTLRTDEDARTAARLLHARTGASVIITRGEHGMWVLDGSAPSLHEAALPAVAREVADVTGAGDTVIAVLALALAAGAPLVEAARMANAAAGLVVARFGPATLTAAELSAALEALRG